MPCRTRLKLLLPALTLVCAVPVDANFFVRGKFMYEDRPFNERGFTLEKPSLPIRYGDVEVLDNTDPANPIRLGTATSTDENGEFSTFVPAISRLDIIVRCYARTDTRSDLDVRVVDSGGAVYAVATPEALYEGHNPSQDIDFRGAPILAKRAHGAEALNVFDSLINGADGCARLHGARPQDILVAYWEAGSADGTYYTKNGLINEIHLLGLPDDSDAYDDVVILHEFGHFVAQNYSKDDSLGGPHHPWQEKQDLRLAWSEGWATFFACMVRHGLLNANQAQQYIDTTNADERTNALISYDNESLDVDRLVGVDPDLLPELSDVAIGSVNEAGVSAILWDIYDTPDVRDDSSGVDDTEITADERFLRDGIDNDYDGDIDEPDEISPFDRDRVDNNRDGRIDEPGEVQPVDQMAISDAADRVWRVMAFLRRGPDVTLEEFWKGWFAPTIANGYREGLEFIFGVRGAEYYADRWEPDDTTASATPIDVRAGELSHHSYYPVGDIDMFSFSAVGSGVYVIETSNLSCGADTSLVVLDRNGVTVLTTHDDVDLTAVPPDLRSLIVFSAPETGTYYVISSQSGKVGTLARFGSYDLRIYGPPIGEASFTVGQETVLRGQTDVDLPVSMEVGAGTEPVQIQFDMAFDPGVVELVSVTAGSAASAAGKTVTVDEREVASGQISIDIRGGTSAMGSGDLVFLRVDVLDSAASGASRIGISEIAALNAGGNRYSTPFTDGEIYVVAPGSATLGFTEAYALAGQTDVALPLSFVPVAGTQAVRLALDAGYDPAHALVVEARLASALLAVGKRLSLEQATPGSVHLEISGGGSNPIPKGNIAYLQFDVAEEAVPGEIPVAITEASCYNILDYPVALSVTGPGVLAVIARGDVDGDGKVTILDAYLAALHEAGLVELSAKELAAGDVDGDGQVTILDAYVIALIEAGIM